MRTRITGILTLAVLALVAFVPLVPSGAAAQSIFLEPNPSQALTLEALRPSRDELEYQGLSASFYLSGRFAANDRMNVVFEVPYATYEVEFSYYDYYSGGVVTYERDGSSIGNPYLGFEIGREDQPSSLEVGIRLPVVGDGSEAAGFGLNADLVERMEAHAPDVLPIYFGMNHRVRSEGGLAFRLRMTPVLWVYTEDTGDDGLELFLLHSVQAGYENETVMIGGGISGRFLATGDADGFGNRSIYQVGLYSNFDFGTFMPGFQVRIPLDSDLRDAGYNPTYSLSIGMRI